MVHISKLVCVSYLSSEVSVDSNKVVELCKDLPEDFIIHLTPFPRVKFSGGTRVKGYIADHQGKATRG